MLTFGRSLRKTTILYVNFWILFFFSMGAALSKVRVSYSLCCKVPNDLDW